MPTKNPKGGVTKQPSLRQLQRKAERLDARQGKQKDELRRTAEELKAVKEQIRAVKAAARAAKAG